MVSIPAPSFDAQRAWQYTKEVTAFGPRPVGSANHKKIEQYILSHVKGDQVEDDDFVADTIEGKFPVHNIVAKFPGTRDGILVVAGHYDTNYPFRNNGYVGANYGQKNARVIASGWFGLTAKKPCESGRILTASMERVI